MALFKKKSNAKQSCCGDVSTDKITQAQAMQNESTGIKILGSGCKKCNELEANTKAALAQLGMDTVIEHITDFAVIASYGIMTTPALVVGKKVVSYGKVLNTDEIVRLLKKR
ncbi:thioredoxin family protein [Eubacteriales bacterium OttesenSCG-928-G02]|nr:thioredoxin family protein [Eubacteriales bacterium OttesenSCG-928-G02]